MGERHEDRDVGSDAQAVAEELLTAEERRARDRVAARARGRGTGELWAFAFDSPIRAQEALLAAMRLVGRGHLELEDAAVVTRVGSRVRITQTKDVSTGQATVGGLWLGVLAGLFVGGPLLGAALGAAAGGLFGKLHDIGIDDDEMRRMGEELREGEAPLFLLVADCHRAQALLEVARFPGRLLATTSEPELAETVRDRLAVDPWAS
jgi:uncharacterized membrane protein